MNMNSTETLKKILESEEFVLAEVNKIRVLYNLKKEIRYDHKRVHESHTESVAEHIYAMHCLIDYFLPLENPEGNWNAHRIHLMAQYHDIDEIETGDVLGYTKTEAQHAEERAAAETVIDRLPDTLKGIIKDSLDEYEKQESFESKFVKAIDKVEPLFHLCSLEGQSTMLNNKTTREQSDSIKYPYVNGFQSIKRFTDVLTDKFVKDNFFYTES
ncbi:HD domain-containing protein [Candidatus Kaiserbacteria bacterium]|nr:HD domain-containing protein [Candidatus Kaiserbacteria bacterium]